MHRVTLQLVRDDRDVRKVGRIIDLDDCMTITVDSGESSRRCCRLVQIVHGPYMTNNRPKRDEA